MAGVSKQVGNAIQATVFLLEETEDMAINDTVKMIFESYIMEFTSNMKQLMDDVKEKVDLHLREVITKLAQEAVKAMTPETGSLTAEASMLKAQSYASALFNPPPHINPKVAAKEA